MGNGVRKVIPSCALWIIRNKFPSQDNKYVNFVQSDKSDMKQLAVNPF